MVAVELGALVIDLGIAHTLSQHNLCALLNGSQHTYMPGECMGREQSRIGIIIRLFKNGRVSFPIISPT